MWDVVYAVDASSSMGDETKSKSGGPYVKIEGVKEGIQLTVKGASLPFGSRVGVMGFRAPTKALGMMIDANQDIAQYLLPLTPVGSLLTNPALLRDSLDKLKVGGATPTGEGLKKAVEMLYSGPEETRKRIKKVILVTDEKSNAGPKPDAILDAKLVRRAIVDVVAIGPATDRKILEALATRTGGKFVQVGTAAELSVALNPRIPYSDPQPENALIVEGKRVAEVLKATDKSAASYAGLVAAAGAVKAKMEQRLQETVSLEGQTRGDVDLVISAATNDPKWPAMSMREFADRVWSRAADLARLQSLEESYRRAIAALPA